MDLFISWSGKTSGELAKVLRDWLPSVIQAVKPYFSTDDIEKGTRGNTMLAKELEDASIGILCLTRENLEAPWIMFEAGSLSKSLDTSRVCPILFGKLSTTDLKGPLTQFQAARFNKQEIRKLIETINSQLGDSALDPKTLETVFEKWWPELDEKVKKLLSSVPKETGEKLRSDRELLEEILTLARQIPPINKLGKTTRDLLSFTTMQGQPPGGGGGGKPPGAPPGCFPADTPVWIDGAQVQISKVTAGQKVGKLDTTDAVSCFKKLVCLKEIENIKEYQGTDDYYNIVLENGNRINVVHSHYFLTVSGQWVLVENLKVGSKLQSLKGQISIKTVAKRELPFTGKYYNLKIKGGDRYFVGKDGVTVRGY